MSSGHTFHRFIAASCTLSRTNCNIPGMFSGKAKWLIAAIAIIIVFALLGRRAAGYIPAFATWVESLGAIGPLVFIAGYIIATVALVPGSLLTLAAGALFGLVRGTLFVFV